MGLDEPHPVSLVASGDDLVPSVCRVDHPHRGISLIWVDDPHMGIPLIWIDDPDGGCLVGGDQSDGGVLKI